MSVSREAEARLTIFSTLFERWNRSINLVSQASLPFLRTRHINDSVQIARFVTEATRKWVDIGSGGGFPGLVVAAVIAESRPECQVVLVESDLRKATFLREAARQMAVRVIVEPVRIETLAPQDADILSARALAELPALCGYASRHLNKDGVALFFKGAKYESEVVKARRAGWEFAMDIHNSESDPSGVILGLKDIHCVA
jgi:16S rRNA (guanine527-N7)-methyltransferase